MHSFKTFEATDHTPLIANEMSMNFPKVLQN